MDFLLTLAAGLLYVKAAAEDAVHDVFVRLAASSDDFKLKGSLKSYLATCVLNRSRDMLRASRATFFYDKLVREKKEPAYYGHTATLSDPNAVLVRWKLSKNKYRVIYTSLKAETVTTDRLHELESQLPPE